MSDNEVVQGVASFRTPTFICHDPTLWFTILECNFKAHHVSSSLTKFIHATTLLPHDVLSQVSGAISEAASSSDSRYKDLKPSITTRLQEMLSKEELGNEWPSDLIRRMKRLFVDKYASFDQEMFSHLFYQRMPPDIQRNLFSVKGKLPLDDFAKLADDFMASILAALRPTVLRVYDSSETAQLAALVSQLSLEVSTLKEVLLECLRRRSPSPRRHSHHCRFSSRPKHTLAIATYKTGSAGTPGRARLAATSRTR